MPSHLCQAVAGPQRRRGRGPEQLHSKVALPLGPVLAGHALAALPRGAQDLGVHLCVREAAVVFSIMALP